MADYLDEPNINATQVAARFKRIKARHAHRDARMAQVAAIRAGQMASVAPDLFPEGGPFQEPIIANLIDVAARDLAEMLAPLPSFNCSSLTMVSEKAQKHATTRTKIANGYITTSNLQVQMYSAADQYVTFGFLPMRVEVDYDRKTPIIRALNPVGCYAEKDRYGRVVAFYQRTIVTRDELAAQFPELAHKIKKNQDWYSSGTCEVVFYHDKDWDLAYLADSDPTILTKVRNPIGKVMVRVAERPGPGDIARGQFDDVIFVQLAKARLALLTLQNTHDIVNAPLVVPSDVPDVPFGPGATMRSNNPQGARKMEIPAPVAAYQEQQMLEQELKLGSRFPDVRTGNANASIVTGKGVEALLGGYDSQVRGSQAIFAREFAEIVSLCFEVDEALFPGEEKTLRGTENGVPYEVKYTPGKDIKGDTTVDVRYGLMAGMDPNRWLVFSLQARAEKMFSRDTMRREMPMDLDVEDEARKVDIEDLEEAAKQAIMGYAQSIPVLASNGQDPSGPLAALAKVIQDRRKGISLADSVVEAFTPPAPPEPSPEEMAAQMAAQGGMPAEPGMPGEPGVGPEGQPPFGLGPTGLLKGVAPGQAGMAPGGRPDLAMMMAGLDARGNPNLTAGISKRIAV